MWNLAGNDSDSLGPPDSVSPERERATLTLPPDELEALDFYNINALPELMIERLARRVEAAMPQGRMARPHTWSTVNESSVH